MALLNYPVIVQNTVTNLVNLLDNVMVGSLGTTHMSGVAIGNHLIFVFNLSIFGALSGLVFTGPSLLEPKTGKFSGNSTAATPCLGGNHCVAAIVLLSGLPLLSLYLGEGNLADSAAMLLYGKQYLKIMLWGLLPLLWPKVTAVPCVEAGETVLPMPALFLFLSIWSSITS